MTLAHGTPGTAGHSLRDGAVFWALFAVVAVAVRGVRWDENYEFAQVILGQVAFPEGHPLHQYVRSFFSLQPFGLAALMEIAPGPFLANFLRNVLFLAASTVPVYLWGALLARRPLAGHIVAIFVLLEIHVPFYSSYPIHVWPHVFSNGPIGLGYMLIGAWALASDRHRLAGALLGFAPLVHLGQFPPLLAVAALYIGWNLYQRRFHAMARLGMAFLPGLAACLAFGLFLKGFAVAPPTDGPYFTDADPMVLWRTYMERYATHRAIPYTTGHLALVAGLLLGAQGLALHARQRPATTTGTRRGFLETPQAWAILYMAVAAGTVWAIMAVHRVLGADIPFLLAGWLPYRLMNHVAPLLIPLALAAGFRRNRGTPPWLLPLLLLALAAALARWISHPLAERYLASGEFLLFLVAGAALGANTVQLMRCGRAWGAASVLGILLCLGILGWVHQYGAACTALGVVAGSLPDLSQRARRYARPAAVALTGLLLIALLGREGAKREHLHVEPFFHEVAVYLAAEQAEDAMVLVPYMQVGMQMWTGHPVMADMATVLFTPYRPPIAPAVNAVFQDFYGIYLDPDAPAPDRDLAWHEIWPRKSPGEWQRLSEKYQVHYIIAPSFMTLPLDRVVEGEAYGLYTIPRKAPDGN